jgi:hypothetical protein
VCLICHYFGDSRKDLSDAPSVNGRICRNVASNSRAAVRWRDKGRGGGSRVISQTG